jgi:8-oxo-dGTP pyrophosphatase MutT (NUDIX family)
LTRNKTRKVYRRDRRHQFAALPWRVGAQGLEILLITSRETRRWVIPKGWPMKDRAAHQAAAQEAFEEAGVQGDIAGVPLGMFRYLKRLKGDKTQLCAVDVFPLQVTEILEIWPEQEERRREWVTPEEASRRVDEPELTALIEAFAFLYAGARAP